MMRHIGGEGLAANVRIPSFGGEVFKIVQKKTSRFERSAHEVSVAVTHRTRDRKCILICPYHLCKLRPVFLTKK